MTTYYHLDSVVQGLRYDLAKWLGIKESHDIKAQQPGLWNVGREGIRSSFLHMALSRSDFIATQAFI